jgi:hypothetical protein
MNSDFTSIVSVSLGSSGGLLLNYSYFLAILVKVGEFQFFFELFWLLLFFAFLGFLIAFCKLFEEGIFLVGFIEATF